MESYCVVSQGERGDHWAKAHVEAGQRPFVHFIEHHRLLRTEPAKLLAHLQLLDRYGEVWVVDSERRCIARRA